MPRTAIVAPASSGNSLVTKPPTTGMTSSASHSAAGRGNRGRLLRSTAATPPGPIAHSEKPKHHTAQKNTKPPI
jgi:hypothetical protein